MDAAAEATDNQQTPIIITGTRIEGASGTKTGTALIETPQAISVISAERFENMGALNLQDTLRYTAGVRTEAYGLDTRGDYGFIRGTDPGVYQDGLRRSFGFRVGSKPEIFTLSRVEVLRGPSSMLYGQGSTGGLINIVTKTPEFEAKGEAFASYGTFNRKEAAFDITGPIAGTLAGRLIGLVRDSDSQTDFAGERRLLINPSLRWAPSPDTDLTLIGLVQDDDSGWTGQFLPYVGTLFPAPNGMLDWDTHLGEPSYDKVDLNTEWASALLTHRFSPSVQFNQAARYEEFSSDQALNYADVYTSPTDPFVDAEDRVLNRFIYAEIYHSKTLSSDSRFQFDLVTGPLTHTLLAGVDYSRYRTRSRSGFDLGTPIDAYDPVYGNFAPVELFDDPRQKQSQLGFYLQNQIKAFDRATIVFGIRRDRATNETVGGERFVDKATTKRAGLLYDLGGGLVPYVSYSESFQPIAGLDLFGDQFRPQRGRQYEIGAKWQPDPFTFVTVAAYDLQDRNRLVADPDNPLNSIQAGVIDTQGFEVEASRSVAKDFDIIATYSYTRAKNRSLDGQQFESIPKHLASIWGMKHFALGPDTVLRTGAGLRYVGESYSNSFDATGAAFTVTSPDYLLADALIGVDRGPWRLSVNATNLFDKKYYTTCLGRGDCFLGLRRTVNVTLGHRF